MIRKFPLLLRLLQQLIHSCGRASAMREALPPAAGGRENAGGDGPSPAAGCGAGRTRAAGLETAGGGWGFRTAAPPPCEDPGRSGRRPGCTPPAPSLTGALCEVGGAQQSKWPRGRGLAFLPWWPTVHHRPEARRVPGRVCSSLFFFFRSRKCSPRWHRGGGRVADGGSGRSPSVRLILGPSKSCPREGNQELGLDTWG